MSGYPTDDTGPARNLVAITAADSDLAQTIRGLYVGTTGNVRVTTAGGQDVVIPSVPAGALIPIVVKRVWATNTTASGFVGFF